MCDARRRKQNKQKQIQSRETNIFNFVRLLVLRLVYGIATSMGFGENISEFLGGIFVPPGVEDDDDDLDFDYWTEKMCMHSCRFSKAQMNCTATYKALANIMYRHSIQKILRCDAMRYPVGKIGS
jgi:hypothetical protein